MKASYLTTSMMSAFHYFVFLKSEFDKFPISVIEALMKQGSFKCGKMSSTCQIAT